MYHHRFYAMHRLMCSLVFGTALTTVCAQTMQAHNHFDVAMRENGREEEKKNTHTTLEMHSSKLNGWLFAVHCNPTNTRHRRRCIEANVLAYKFTSLAILYCSRRIQRGRCLRS